jgi:GTPase SAR1 family protein
MGGCCSGPEAPSDGDSDDFGGDRAVKLDHAKSALLLGTGSSGKTTFVRSMKHALGQDDSEREVREVIYTIRVNCVRYMKKLVFNGRQLAERDGVKYAECIVGIGEDDGEAAEHIFVLQTMPSERDTGTVILAPWKKALSALWKADGIRATYRQRHLNFWFPDNMEYYFDQVGDIFDGAYTPTLDDSLKCSIPSSGFVERPFAKDGQALKFIDMGGRRNERKQWPTRFYQIYSVVFVVSLPDYASVLLEDESRNSMHEAIDVFASVASFDELAHAPFFLLLNKEKLFNERLKTQSLSECFSREKGWRGDESWSDAGASPATALAFIRKVFENRKGSRHSLNVHVINAVEPSEVSPLFEDILRAVSQTKIPAVAAAGGVV